MTTRPATVPATGELWPEVTSPTARRLMAEAVELFAERGYHATTTRDIATAAGMSPAALYVHFPSKAAVLYAISRSGHTEALRLVHDLTAEDPAERLAEFVARFVAWHARGHRIARVVQYELHALPEAEFAEVAALRRQTERAVREMIEAGVAAGRFRVDDVRTAARAILSLGIDVARWYGDSPRPAPDTLGRRYAALAPKPDS
ncbi:MAG: TetR/AcrR family transcriptional regulator [Micromonosporaceae bacterium]